MNDTPQRFSVSPSLVEAAARAIGQGWHSACSDTRIAEAVLDAVGDALRLDGWQTRDAEDGFIRQEAAQAERERCIEVVRDFPLNICGDGSPMPRDQAVQVEDFRAAVLRELGGVHPEASDG